MCVTICNIIFKPKTAVVAMAVYLDLHPPCDEQF